MGAAAFMGLLLPITIIPPLVIILSIALTLSQLSGMAAFAILPVALELSVECTYPVNEGTCAGFLWVAVFVECRPCARAC